MEGTTTVANIYTRQGGEWVDTATTVNIYLQPRSARLAVSADRFIVTTHKAIADPTPVVVTGAKLVVGVGEYHVNMSQMHSTPNENHHQELFLTKAA